MPSSRSDSSDVQTQHDRFLAYLARADKFLVAAQDFARKARERSEMLAANARQSDSRATRRD
jgi:hypothetical protein